MIYICNLQERGPVFARQPVGKETDRSHDTCASVILVSPISGQSPCFRKKFLYQLYRLYIPPS